MKKIGAFMLALLCAMLCSCGEKTPADVSVNVPGDNPMGGSDSPAAELPERQHYRMILFGDAFTGAYNMADIPALFADADGITLDCAGISFQNRNTTLKYNIDELFSFSGPEAEAKLLSLNDDGIGLLYSNSLALAPVDLLLVLGARDWILSDKNRTAHILKGFDEMTKLYAASNPDGKTAIIAPTAFAEGTSFYSEILGMVPISPEEHAEKTACLPRRWRSFPPRPAIFGISLPLL